MVSNGEPHGISELMRKDIVRDYKKNALKSFVVFCMHHANQMEGSPYSSLSPCPGQAEDTIRLITKLALIKLLLPWWLMILQSLEPPGAKNAHLSDVHHAVEVELTLKSRAANAYGSVLL